MKLDMLLKLNINPKKLYGLIHKRFAFLIKQLA